MRALLLLAPIATLLFPIGAMADPLQDQLLARIRATDTSAVALVATTRIERTGAAAQVIVTRYDPHAAAGQRWSIVQVDGRPATAKEAKAILKAANGAPVPGYNRMARWFGAPATRVGERPGSVTYRWARLPAGVVKIGSHDASGDTQAEALVDTSGPVPFVRQVRFTSTTGFRMMLVAKVERYVFTSGYALLPDGRAFPAGQDAEIAGAMMGKAGNLVTRTRYAAH